MIFLANEQQKNKRICIVGAGLVGTLLAILLAEAGFAVDVYEKREDPREGVESRGRSIALSLSDRGWKALRQVGLDKAIRPNTDPAYGRMIHEKDGVTHSQEYGDGEQAIGTVNRNYLNTMLITKAIATHGVRFFFEHACRAIDEKNNEITFVDREMNALPAKHYDHIVGVDGIFSAVRKALVEKDLLTFESATLDFGYKELRMPPNAKGEHVFADHRVHVWPRKKSVLIGFPINEGSFILTFFLPLKGPDSLESITAPAILRSFFKREYKELMPFISNLTRDFFQHNISTITQVKGAPWHYKDQILLMGDACHAVTPFYGMGMNIGFEDCTVFMELLRENNFDFGRTFASFETVRKADTDAMTDLSYKNFQSLNEAPHPHYQLKWVLERRIWKLFPEEWSPTYVLIAFSETPLRDVPFIKARQERILDALIERDPHILDLSDDELRTMLTAELRVDGLKRSEEVNV